MASNVTETTPEQRQANFDAKEYYMFDRVSGERYCDIMTRDQFNIMLERKTREADGRYKRYDDV